MSVIWKFGVSHLGLVGIPMPPNACPISAGAQGDDLVVWAIVEPCERHEFVDHLIEVVPTGASVPRGNHLGTVTFANGALVWHVFDGGEAVPSFCGRAGVPVSETFTPRCTLPNGHDGPCNWEERIARRNQLRAEAAQRSNS